MRRFFIDTYLGRGALVYMTCSFEKSEIETQNQQTHDMGMG